METFTPASALIGGALIGTAAVLLMWLDGRIAGVSGIAGGLLAPTHGDILWRAAFVGGLIGGALVWRLSDSAPQMLTITPSVPLLIVGGLMVGIGVRLGNGCTSGHGICGIARGASRSLAATAIFMLVAIATVFVTRHMLGDATP